jgi:hypothetical protein
LRVPGGKSGIWSYFAINNSSPRPHKPYTKPCLPIESSAPGVRTWFGPSAQPQVSVTRYQFAPELGDGRVKFTPPYTPSPAMQHDINHVAGLGDVATHLDWIGDAVARLTHDDHNVGVTVCQNRYGGPIKLTLAANDEEDTLDRLVTAFERIADSVAKLAGLTRPRLEEWHHQDAYEPRYYDAPGGEAPGPKTAARDVSTK